MEEEARGGARAKAKGGAGENLDSLAGLHFMRILMCTRQPLNPTLNRDQHPARRGRQGRQGRRDHRGRRGRQKLAHQASDAEIHA